MMARRINLWPRAFVAGWHFNIYGGDAVEALALMEITAPANPVRKLAGT